ncbi:MAG: hypothetical protein OXE50_16110, partial [Chloroflexi bacterium]|nr:hypothetical protein [Chloroflexota bacterium]
IVKQINEWIQEFQDLDDRAQSAIAWAAALSAGLTTLLAVLGSVTIALGALTAAVNTLAGTALPRILASITKGFSALATTGGLAATAIVTIAEAWRQIFDDFQRQGSLFEDGIPLEQIHRLGDTSDELELIKLRLAELRQEYARFNSEGNAEAVAQIGQEYQTLLERLQALQQQSQSISIPIPILPTAEVQAKSLAEQIVVVDFEIRKLEQTLSRATAPEQVLSNSIKLQEALEKEAELLRERAKSIEDSDQRQAELTRIGLQLEVDKARTQDRAGKAIIKINNEVDRSYQKQLKSLQDIRYEAGRRQRAIGQYFGQSIANLREQAHEGRLAAEAALQFQKNVDLLNSALERSIETRRQIAKQRREDAAIDRLESGKSDRARREQDAFSDIIPGEPTPLDKLQQQAAQEGSDFIIQLYRKQSEELEKELKDQYRSYERFGDLISSSLGNLLRETNLNEILISFIQTYTKIILQENIRAQIQKRIDDEVTDHKLANLARLEAANQTSVVNLLRSSGYVSGVSGIGSVVSLFNPAAGSAVSAAGAIINALQSDNAPNAPKAPVRSVVLELDSKEVARTLINGEAEGKYRLMPQGN